MVGLPDEIRGLATQANQYAVLTLRKLLDEIENDSSMSATELMWQVRSHTRNKAEIPQAIFRVGDRLASVIYIELASCWEVQLDGDAPQFCWEVHLDGDEHQFDTFEEVLGFIERRRREDRPSEGHATGK